MRCGIAGRGGVEIAAGVKGLAKGGEDPLGGGFEGAGDGVAAGADVAAAAEGLGDAGDIDASLAAQADPVAHAGISRKNAVASTP